MNDETAQKFYGLSKQIKKKKKKKDKIIDKRQLISMYFNIKFYLSRHNTKPQTLC